MVKVLVTGNAGFIGSHLTDELIKRGFEVYGIDNLSTGKRENINPKCKFVKIDLCDYDRLDNFITQIKPKYVFHFAALARIQPSIADPLRWNDNNVNATLNLLWSCKKNNVKKVVFSSSSSVYGDNEPPFVETMLPDPKSPYALSKYLCERWCKLFYNLYGLDITILRYFNVYGKRQLLEGDYATVIGIFMRQAERGEKLTIVGDGKQRRDFTYVKDVVRANICALKAGFDIYNIGTGNNYRIKDVAKLIQPDKKMHLYGIKRISEADITLADISNAEKIYWGPAYTLEEGLNDIISG